MLSAMLQENISTTHFPKESLHDAATYVRLNDQRQGLKISCPEEIAWRKGGITDGELIEIASKNSASSYSQYLNSLLDKKKHEI